MYTILFLLLFICSNQSLLIMAMEEQHDKGKEA